VPRKARTSRDDRTEGTMGTDNALFFTLEEKERLIRFADFQVRGCTPGTFRKVKRLLWAIETTPADARTAEILSAKSGIVRSTYNRALELGKLLGVLNVVEHRGGINSFRIDWHQVRRFIYAEPALETQPGPLPNRRAPKSDPSQIGGLPKKSEGSDFSGNAAFSGTIPAIRESSFHESCIHEMNVMNELNHSSPSIHEKAAPSSQKHPGGWPVVVSADVLRHSDRVQKLFEYALARNWVSEFDRLDFFATARACRRGAESGRLRQSGAKFTSLVKRKDWSFASEQDRTKAAEGIEAYDRGLGRHGEGAFSGTARAE